MIRTTVCSTVSFQLGRSAFATAALLVSLGVLVLVPVALRTLLLLLLLLLELISNTMGATRPISSSYALVVCFWVLATIIVEKNRNRCVEYLAE